MNVDITGARIYFTIPIFGGIPITATIVNSLLVTLIIIGLSIFLTRNLKVRAVSRRQVVAEFLVETAQNFVNGNMGEKFAYYGPFVAALFASSLFSSLLSLVGMFPPTSDLSTTLAWAVMVFVLITYTKIDQFGTMHKKRKDFHYKIILKMFFTNGTMRTKQDRTRPAGTGTRCAPSPIYQKQEDHYEKAVRRRSRAGSVRRHFCRL